MFKGYFLKYNDMNHLRLLPLKSPKLNWTIFILYKREERGSNHFLTWSEKNSKYFRKDRNWDCASKISSFHPHTSASIWLYFCSSWSLGLMNENKRKNFRITISSTLIFTIIWCGWVLVVKKIKISSFESDIYPITICYIG